jgi:hypothetical protein
MGKGVLHARDPFSIRPGHTVRPRYFHFGFRTDQEPVAVISDNYPETHLLLTPMKLCPLCKNRYTDDTLVFCLQDGAPLVAASNPESGEPTVSFGEGDIPPRRTENAGAGMDDLPENDDIETRERIPRTVAETGAADRSNTLRTVLATIAAMIALFVVIGGIGAIYYFVSGGGASNASKSAMPGSDSNAADANGETTVPTPVPSATATVKPTATPQASPTIDRETVRSAVERRLAVWKRAAEHRDLDALLSCYSDKLDYYFSRRGVEKSFVRNNKSGAFEKYDTISITISNLSITVGDRGDSAIATFDKGWRFEGGGKVSKGMVRSQVSFKLFGNGAWLINGEKDLKVYFVD